MAVVGKATLNVFPKFPGFSDAVKKQLGSVDGAASGRKAGADYGRGMGSGLAKSGAVIGAFSAVTSKAMDAISGSIGGAISRFDTLNNYPRVMQSLGYSAKDSEGSIKKMSDRLQGLPTRLDAMASTVQGIVVTTHDLNKATDAGLALNDMLLASGSNQQIVNGAMEQFRQMLAKGKPDMQDWKSLTSAMPGQLDQLAKSMLGPTANADDLYQALGGGGHEATISTDDLLAAMIKLDTEGGDGITSFAEQAKTATGGVQTSAENLGNAFSRGISGLMDEVGKDNIAEVFGDIKNAVDGAFRAIGPIVGAAVPVIKSLYDSLKQIGPAAVPAAAGVAALVGAGKGLSGLSSLVGGASKAFSGIRGTAKGASEALLTLSTKMKDGSRASEGLFKAAGILSGAMGGPLVVGLGLAAAAAGFVVGAFLDAKKKSDDFEKATSGLNGAVERATSLGDYAGKIGGIGASAGTSALSVDQLNESIAKSVDKMNETSEKAEGEIAQLNTAKGIIDDYTGVTDLSSEAQGKLQWAIKLVNDQFGLNIKASDVAAGKYVDASGKVQDLKKSIDDLIESKKKEIKMNALSDDLTEAYKNQDDAVKTLAGAKKNLADLEDQYASKQTHSQAEMDNYAHAHANMKREVDKGSKALEETNETVGRLEGSLGDASKALSGNADEFDKWGDKAGKSFGALVEAYGNGFGGFKEDLRRLGADFGKFSTLNGDQLDKLAKEYDGTAASVVGDLKEWGVVTDDTKIKTAEAAKAIADSLNGLDGVTDSLKDSGVNVNDFANKLADAGVSAEDLNAIGSENLSQLAKACDGNMGMMVWAVKNYNDTGILDKDGKVRVDDVQLMDAQGNVYTWNGTDLLGKDGKAEVNAVSVIDAQGRKLEWNGSRLEYKSAYGKVTDIGMSAGVQKRNEWNDHGLNDWEGRGVINIVKSISEIFTGGSQNAAGGIRPHADGGFRFHAGGAIATRAIPLDIVGEDGAEAIVPLTNKRYSLPFAMTIAEQMKSQGGSLTKADVYDAMAAALSPLADREVAVYVDGRKLASSLTGHIGREILNETTRRRRALT